jgi:hypothetical protein
MALKTRRPTGAVPWPVILVEGGEKSGKSFGAAQFSASERVGQTYWIDIAEGAADEYGAIPGARYLVVEHDGTFHSIYTAVEEVKAEAQKAAEVGDPPVVLVIDSMTAEWDLLKDMAALRARKSPANQKRLAADPGAEVKVPMNVWNEVGAKHRRLMTTLLTFPGIVVLIARGKDVAALDDSGKPIEGSKEYKVEGHKTLAFDSSAWVRLSRDHAPMVIGLRSVHAGMRPGVDKPKPAPQFTLEWLVFDVLKCDPSKAHVRDLKDASEAPEPESGEELSAQRELLQVKHEVAEAAQAIGWDKDKFMAAYAEEHDGANISNATVEDLRGFRDFLKLCAQQPAEPAEKPALAPVRDAA